MKRFLLFSVLMFPSLYPMITDIVVPMADHVITLSHSFKSVKKINFLMRSTGLSLSGLNEASKNNSILLDYITNDSIAIEDNSTVLSSLK